MDGDRRNEHYLRIRPKSDSNLAFYAPAADITHGMRGVVKAALRVFDAWEDPSRLLKFVQRAAQFQRDAALSGARWETDGLKGVEGMLEGLSDVERDMLLMGFFRAVMDFYWHSMRLNTESPEVDPKAMEEALSVTETLRNMPRAMREEYLEHMREFNKLPKILEAKGLFKEEAANDSK